VVERAQLQEMLVAAIDAAGADAGAISQLLGDVLILVADQAPPGRVLQTGHGYLVSDFPLTQEVISQRAARAVSLADERADEAEAVLLRELGYDALLMLPLVVDGEVWGLVELYAEGRALDGHALAVEAALARTPAA
jgi:GAF domain-containing protein